MMGGGLIYANPHAAYLFLLIPVMAGLFFFLLRHRERIAKILGGKELLSKEMCTRAPANFWGRALLTLGVWVFAALALMDPKSNPRYPESFEKENRSEKTETTEKKRKAHEVIFLLDVSASMSVADMREGKNRLEVAKEIADETIRRLNGESVSLFAYTSEIDKLVPSTLNYLFTRLVLRNVEIDEVGVGGTDIYRALRDLLKDDSFKPDQKPKTIILLSDGGDIAYEDGSAIQKKEYEEALAKLVDTPEEKNMRILTVGVGTEEGGEIPNILFEGKKVRSHLDPSLLKLLSISARGQYYSANAYDPVDLSKALAEQVSRDSQFLQGYEMETHYYLDPAGEYFIYDSLFRTPLLIAILLLGIAIAFPKNWRFFRYLPVILLLQGSCFGEESSDRKMERASLYFEAGDSERARRIYDELLRRENEGWKRSILKFNLGTVDLQEGNFEGALERFSAIALGDKPFPLFAISLKSNSAIAKGRAASAILDKMIAGKNFYEEEYFIMVVLLNQALMDVKEASEAHCRLLMDEGASQCTPSPALNQLRDALEGELSAIREQYLKKAADNGTPDLYDGDFSLERLKTFQSTRREKWNEKAKKQPTAEDYLEQLIFEQMISFLANNSIQELPQDAEAKKSGLDADMQENTLNFASEFWGFAIQEQKRVYQKCLYQPWSEVISLFEKGVREAEKAQSLLKEDRGKRDALIHQAAAMRFWRQAVEKLKSPPSPEEEQKPQEPKSSINEILRQLQQMEQEDRPAKVKEKKVTILKEKSY